MIRRAVPGVYKIQTNYFGSQEQKLTGGTTVQATVITNFGRSTEKRQHLTLRLTQNKETVTIGEVRVGG
jgi:Ca-activated chloride channel homolog